MGSASRKRKWHAQPAGKPKGGHSWDHYEAKWVPDKAPVSGTDASLVPMDGAGGATMEAAGAPAKKKKDRHRMFSNGRKGVMTGLLLVSTLPAAGLSVCPSEKGADCVGCSECAAMFCSTFQLSGEDNTFTRGCRYFHKPACTRHAGTWHAPRAPAGAIVEGLARTITAQAGNIKHVMMNVYWLAKESVSIRKIASLVVLTRLHGVVLSAHYTNEKAVREFVMCITAVLRKRVIVAAQSSPCLWPMVDEPTGVSSMDQAFYTFVFSWAERLSLSSGELCRLAMRVPWASFL